jgi:nitrogenase molybdenum-iron protein alpha/beta subunit
MKQTSRIISTYSADSMGVCSALFELGGMTIMHDASGCNSTYTTHDEPRWYDMDSMVYISALTEMDAIMGNDEKLLSDIEDAVRELHPKFVAICGTPIPTMTGFDFESVARLAEFRTGIPCMGFPTTGMNTYIHGASMAFEETARRFVKDRSEEITNPGADSNVGIGTENNVDSAKLRVNILGLTPLDFSVNGTDMSIEEWLESENFEIVSKWAMGSTLDEISRSAEADVNLVVSAAGFGAARVLYERFGIPYAVGLPIGNEMPGLFSDLIKTKVKEFIEADASGETTSTFETREISLESGIFLSSESDSKDKYDKDFAAVIGEGVISKSLATSIEMECAVPAKVLCATECPEEFLRECDRMTPDEDDIIQELKGAKYVIADPLYKPIVPQDAKFISLPSESFSGRLYRAEIPNLVNNPGSILTQIK